MTLGKPPEELTEGQYISVPEGRAHRPVPLGVEPVGARPEPPGQVTGGDEEVGLVLDPVGLYRVEMTTCSAVVAPGTPRMSITSPGRCPSSMGLPGLDQGALGRSRPPGSARARGRRSCRVGPARRPRACHLEARYPDLGREGRLLERLGARPVGVVLPAPLGPGEPRPDPPPVPEAQARAHVRVHVLGAGFVERRQDLRDRGLDLLGGCRGDDASVMKWLTSVSVR